MFQRLKKVLAKTPVKATGNKIGNEGDVWVNTDMNEEAPARSTSQLANLEVGQANSVWREGSGAGSGIQGKLHDKPWKLERAAASRDYISGEEIRGRADIAVNRQASIIIMNRPLQELLEKRAYALYTDSVETEASPTLMEEMRWLALYPQTGWESLSDSFWNRYAVMTSHRAHAMRWLTPQLASLLTSWPELASDAGVPFILMVMRGKVHLRMQLTPADAKTLDHISQVFTTAAQSALDVFSDNPGNPGESAKLL
jgi:hypothetical protein